MFSDKTFETVVFITNFAWALRVSHFHFVKNGNKKGDGEYCPVACFTPSKLLIIKATFVIGTLYLVYIAGRAFEILYLQDQSASLALMVKLSYLFSAYTLPIIIHITTVMKAQEVPAFIMHYVQFFKDMKTKYLLPGQKGAKCRKFFIVMLIVGTLITIQNLMIVLLKPKELHLMTSMVDTKGKSVFKSGPGIILFLLQGNIWTYCFHWVAYTAGCLYLLKELDIKVKQPRTRSQLRNSETSLKILRSMQVLHRYWEDSFQYFLCPAQKATICTICTLGLYGLVKLTGPRSIIMGCVALLAMLYIITMFYKFGLVHEFSGITLENWSHSPSSTKWMRKVLKSIPSLGVYIGNFYIMEKTSIAVVLDKILNSTITLFFL
ncbi:unnamed protein product [Orchesella dallaii]|uniref:Gustatory receptor n=1 Tax=Orchesella dallaii TaxID=48710 RepID=A0ABP1PKZ2_9HEXA